MNKWNILMGDYSEENLNNDPYEIVKKNRIIKKVLVNVGFIIISSVIFVVALEIVNLVVKR